MFADFSITNTKDHVHPLSDLVDFESQTESLAKHFQAKVGQSVSS